MGFKVQYVIAIFRSKLLFGTEMWGGADQTLLSKLQKLQDHASKIALGPHNYKLTNTQREDLLKWLPVKN